MIRLITSDLDGTLLEEDGRLPEGIFETIRALKAKGICFAACSGRQYGNLLRLFAPVVSDMAFVCENGAYSIVEGKEAGITPIPQPLALELIHDVEALGMNLLISGKGTSYVFDRNRKYTDDIIYRLRNTVTIIDALDDIHEPILKVSGQIDAQTMQRVAPVLLEKWGRRVTATVGGKEWFDITVAHKGTGMKILMDHLGVKKNEVMAFGDNFNDEPMFECAGFPFLMEHANPALRKPGVRLCKKVLPVLQQLLEQNGEITISS